MSIVYVDQQGATVRKNGGQLQVVVRGKQPYAIPINEVEQLILQGNVQLTTQAASALLRAEARVLFTDRFGGNPFDLNSRKGRARDALRQQAQLRLIENESRTLAIAKAIVEGKVSNQRVLLMRRAEQDRRLRAPIDGMMAMLKRVQHAQTLDEARGYEGKAAAYYFEALRLFFPEDWGFNGREYHPAPDPANALLSLMYSKLMRDVEMKIQIVGLDSYIGFFHALGYNRPSLALDLMEEFRPILADVVSLSLIGDGQITLYDFERTNEPELPVRMTREALKKVTIAYEARMADRIFHPMQPGEVDYRRAIELQVRQMARVIEGEKPDYEPIRIR
jgi:CRISPR-associated protein Cas1